MAKHSNATQQKNHSIAKVFLKIISLACWSIATFFSLGIFAGIIPMFVIGLIFAALGWLSWHWANKYPGRTQKSRTGNQANQDTNQFTSSPESYKLDETFVAATYDADFIVLDTETTGLSKRDHIIDIGIATVKNGRVTATFSTLVNPHTKIPRSIMNLTGITDQQLAQAPDIQEILPPLLNEIAVLPILGHNIAFDLGMIDNEAKHIGIQGMEPSQIIDTMALSEAMFPNSYGHSLENLLQRLGIDETEQHRALSDALQTFECYCRLKTMSAPITVDWREAQREKEQTKKARQRKNHNFMRDSYLEFVDTTPRNIKPAGFQLEAFGGEHVSGCYKHQQILNSYGRGAYFWVAVRKSKITTGKYTGYPTISINLDGEQIGFLSPQLMSRHYLHIPDGPVVALAHTVNASDITKKIEVRIELPEPHQPIDLAPYVINT